MPNVPTAASLPPHTSTTARSSHTSGAVRIGAGHTAAPDGPADAPGRTWLQSLRDGTQVSQVCPPWCRLTHQTDQGGFLSDLYHLGTAVALGIAVYDAAEGEIVMPLLEAAVRSQPYDPDPRRRVPHVVLDVWEDNGVEVLDPDELAALIARIRAHCDQLDQLHAQLVKARTECAGSEAAKATAVPYRHGTDV